MTISYTIDLQQIAEKAHASYDALDVIRYQFQSQACRDYPVLTPNFRWIMDDMLDGANTMPNSLSCA